MKPIGLGEHGEVFPGKDAAGRPLAIVQYRGWDGRLRRLKRSGATFAEARRRVLRVLDERLAASREGEFTSRSTFREGALAWLVMFEGQVDRGVRSRSTYDLYEHAVHRHVIPGVGSLRLGEGDCCTGR